jgi:hypothetical protein
MKQKLIIKILLIIIVTCICSLPITSGDMHNTIDVTFMIISTCLWLITSILIIKL